MLKIKSCITILTTAVILSACGGGDRNDSKITEDTTPVLTPFTTEFQSTLSLQKDADPIIQISNRSSNQNDEVNAYSVTHHFDSGSNSIILSYNFDKNDINKTLHINYDPILKKVLDVSIGENYLKTDIYNLLNKNFFACANSFFFELCKGIELTFDDHTGYSKINFHNTKLPNSSIVQLSPENNQINQFFTERSYITLNGQLTGSLSTAPQTFNNIRKTSQFNISANHQPNSLMGAVYDPKTKIILFSTHVNNGIDSSLKLAQFSTGIENNSAQHSQLSTETLFGVSGLCNTITSTLPIKDITTIQPTINADNITLAFKQAIYNDKKDAPPNLPNFPIQQDCPTAHVQLDGSVTVNIPSTKLQISAILKNENSFNFVQPALYFDVINHDRQQFGNNALQVKIRNNRIEKIDFRDTRISKDPSTGLLSDHSKYEYSCGYTQACTGLSYDIEKNKISFKNTALTSKNNPANEVNNSITLNGIFDFAGR
ncbi:hypothetical protein F3J02_06945 [Acinetobacter sp. Tr-809]|uniref:hypothetical protein n=1 Tax=Acinetobacter sp. Tr-809 TaxID=2608324 RepID=UPI001420F962|nr:hypothetical protein [Acinetobacter sp. Tr-809]NIE96216.1 hypothetical protein [Acinetobacter sp. Tr-809]